MPVGGGTAGVRQWLRAWARPLLAELLGTALLVCLGVGSTLHPAGEDVPLTHPALGFGFVVCALACALGAASASGAHMNPAVTLAAALTRRLPAPAALAAVLVQFIGGYIGFGVLLLVAPMPHACAGVTTPAAGVSPPAAAAIEALLTGTLVAVACGMWAAHDPARPDHAAPVKLGLTIVGLVYAGGKLTGASLNPARSLAPAHLMSCWAHHWVYWLGPLGGAALAALLQHHVVTPPPPPPPPPAHNHDELPLRGKLDDV